MTRSNSLIFLAPLLWISFTSSLLAGDFAQQLRKAAFATPLNMTLKCSQTNQKDVLVTLENSSDGAISYTSDHTIDGDFRLELYDPAGTLVSTSKYKRKPPEPGAPTVFGGEIVLLKPGEKHTVNLHLPDLFVLSKRGNYSFKVTRKLEANSPPDDEVSCPAITISLDPSKW